MNLVLDIALTHVRARARQTFVAVAGVATGVGFSVMMAALMQGSQVDFIRQLVDVLPHVTISDEQPQIPPQPAERFFAAAEIHGLTPEARRRGIKNPLAIIAGLAAWVPGAVTPSVQTRAILRFAGRDVSASIVGIDPKSEPRVSTLVSKLRQGSLPALYRATNAVILGDRLAEKIGARVGSTITVTATNGSRLTAQVVGLFHMGVRVTDETTAYVLIKTAQIIAAQTGIVNEIRIRLADPMQAKDIAERVARETGYKAVAWMDAQEDLLSIFLIRNIIMYTVVGAILLVASFGTWNIISTITHEKSRDIAILKSLGLRERAVRRIFVIEALVIGVVGAAIGCLIGYLLCRALGSLRFNLTTYADMTRLPLLYSPLHYLIATAVALASSLVAGFFPARKAARLYPVDIIRGAT